MADTILLVRETANGTITSKITAAEARRGLLSRQYIKEPIRDASGRIRGSQLREKYVAPSDAGSSAATLTLENMREIVGEIGTPEDRERSRRKLRMWRAVPMCLYPAPKLRPA